MKKSKLWIAVLVGAMLLLPNMALAAPQCFSLFSGVYIQFDKPITTTSTAQNGRVWGALASCDNLSSWPIVGSSHNSKANGLVFAFRSFTVDANSCGAVDFIGTLSGTPLSGPFELWNQRTNFGSSGTMTEVTPCPIPPTKHEPPAGVDPLGNNAR